MELLAVTSLQDYITERKHRKDSDIARGTLYTIMNLVVEHEQNGPPSFFIWQRGP